MGGVHAERARGPLIALLGANGIFAALVLLSKQAGFALALVAVKVGGEKSPPACGYGGRGHGHRPSEA